jgi:hypothetical protein
MILPSVFIFNLVISKLKVVKFSKFFEIYFFRLTLKEPILLILFVWVNIIQMKNKDFQYFSNIGCSNSANIRLLIYFQHSIMEAKYSQNISKCKEYLK